MPQKLLVNSTINKHDIKLFSADVFLDMPIEKKENKMAVTAYSVLYDYDFGPNYLRNVGIMNIGSVDPNFTGSRAIAGAGNAQPTIDRKHLAHKRCFITCKDAKLKIVSSLWCYL
jgi:hypothetical protein